MRIYATLVLFCLMFSLNKSLGCSPYPWGGFCYGNEYYETIIRGSIIELDKNLAMIKVHHVYKGTETKDTIYVWGLDTNIHVDTGTSCEVSAYIGADKLGNIGDSIIIALNHGDSSSYYWEKNEDYRVPRDGDLLNRYYILSVEGDSIKGDIKHYDPEGDYPGWRLKSMHLADFEALWNDGVMNCDSLQSIAHTNQKQNFNIYPNPSNGSINIKFTDKLIHDIQIFNLQGQSIYQKQSNSTQINLNQPPGIYYVKVDNYIEKLIIN